MPLAAAPDFSLHPLGLLALVVFGLAYILVVLEEWLHLRKSIPVMLAAGAIWALTAIAYAQAGDPHAAEAALRVSLLEYSELLLFLLAAMTFVNTLEERGLFAALRAWLVGRGWSYRRLFWATGALAFLLSPVLDNLTTALVVGAVVTALGAGNPTFVGLSCVNLVVAANAGGAFSPFGDITTLMVWQHGAISFTGFFALVLPALVNWLVPAGLMSFAVGAGTPERQTDTATMLPGAWVVQGIFAATIAMAIIGHSWLHLPPVLGMMTGLGLLKLYAYFAARQPARLQAPASAPPDLPVDEPNDVFAAPQLASGSAPTLDTYKQMERAEWDTLMFFYGVMLAVGGLGALGYLALASTTLYGTLGATTANVLVGLLSAVVDNIPVMAAVLVMNPEMPAGQWLLVTLTAGVGGSLLSVGSAAGVALMGQARGVYTFRLHLRWLWAIALGYAASIATHLLVNRAMF